MFNKINKIRIKNFLQIIIEKITGKTCDKCRYCVDGLCVNFPRHLDCVTSIYPHGFERKKRGEQ